jgi:hypothetical protein
VGTGEPVGVPEPTDSEGHNLLRPDAAPVDWNK